MLSLYSLYTQYNPKLTSNPVVIVQIQKKCLFLDNALHIMMFHWQI